MGKPGVAPATVLKWQRVVDLIAQLAQVPATLIMRTEPPAHRVFVASHSPDTPYAQGQSFELSDRLYCRGVLDDGALTVEDAAQDPRWCDNEDMEWGMSFYMGHVIRWPDGEIFGTICMLDRSRNEAALQFREGLAGFRDVIETDLALLLETARRARAEDLLQQALRDLERRVDERTREIQDANAALRVLIANLETSRVETERVIARRLQRSIKPHLARLRQGLGGHEPQRTQLDLLERGLDMLLTRDSDGLDRIFAQLTPAEIEVAQMVMGGYASKDIARRLNRGKSTIDFHRNNIRAKLGLAPEVNLRSYLLSRR